VHAGTARWADPLRPAATDQLRPAANGRHRRNGLVDIAWRVVEVEAQTAARRRVKLERVMRERCAVAARARLNPRQVLLVQLPSTFGTVTLEAVSYALYALAGLNVFAAIARVAMIGKPRTRVTRGDAIASVVYCAAVATILVIAAMHLG
jgi:hypothetical protein